MKKAFTLIEIMMVVAIIGLLAAIGIPSFLNARKSSETNMKAVNVSAVNAAKEQWSIMENKPIGTALPTTQAGFTNIAAYIGGGITNLAGFNVPVGSTNGITLNAVGTSATY